MTYRHVRDVSTASDATPDFVMLDSLDIGHVEVFVNQRCDELV
ncbi:hypothetical protein [Nocardia sp. NPDC003979]